MQTVVVLVIEAYKYVARVLSVRVKIQACGHLFHSTLDRLPPCVARYTQASYFPPRTHSNLLRAKLDSFQGTRSDIFVVDLVGANK